MNKDPFCPDYVTARRRFRDVVERLGWQLVSYPIPGLTPEGEPLTIDAAIFDGQNSERCVIISSGLHGTEGYFGSAVQLAWLDQLFGRHLPCRVVVIHALNPFGMAWGRRTDAGNVDPGRNFLPPGEVYAGCHPKYADFDRLLNPPSPPSRFEPFLIKAGLAILRHGMPELVQAVATGQYDYPRGLFYGGSEPCPTARVVREQFISWLGDARYVTHLDFHTGLGQWGTWQLLLDVPLTDEQRTWLTTTFGSEAFRESNPKQAFYTVRGGFGEECVRLATGREYLFLCAEFGTYSMVWMLGALRAENRASHYAKPDSVIYRWAKSLLRERSCPSMGDWRKKVIPAGIQLIEKSLIRNEMSR